MSTLRRILFLFIIILAFFDYSHLFYINIFTHSLPYGIYIKLDGKPHLGNYASSCLTPEIAQYGIARGYLAPGICPSGSVRVLKKLKGLPGDHFKIYNNYLELNGFRYCLMNKDSKGRSLRLFYSKSQGILGKDQYMLLSDFVPNSWDSRYWGPVNIDFLLKPFWIFEKTK